MSIKPPVIITKCCRSILGCKECINTWSSGSDVTTRICPCKMIVQHPPITVNSSQLSANKSPTNNSKEPHLNQPAEAKYWVQSITSYNQCKIRQLAGQLVLCWQIPTPSLQNSRKEPHLKQLAEAKSWVIAIRDMMPYIEPFKECLNCNKCAVHNSISTLLDILSVL